MMTIKQMVMGRTAKAKVQDALERREEATVTLIAAKKGVQLASARLRVAEKAQDLAEVTLHKARQESAAVRDQVLGGWRKAWAKTWENVK